MVIPIHSVKFEEDFRDWTGLDYGTQLLLNYMYKHAPSNTPVGGWILARGWHNHMVWNIRG